MYRRTSIQALSTAIVSFYGTLKRFFIALTGVVGLLSAQSPAAQASATIAGESITIKYSSPSVRGRQIFGDGGVVSRDSTYPVWRAGASYLLSRQSVRWVSVPPPTISAARHASA